MTSRPPPRTIRTFSRPSVSTSRNSISEKERYIYVRITCLKNKTLSLGYKLVLQMYGTICLISFFVVIRNSWRRTVIHRIYLSSPHVVGLLWCHVVWQKTTSTHQYPCIRRHFEFTAWAMNLNLWECAHIGHDINCHGPVTVDLVTNCVEFDRSLVCSRRLFLGLPLLWIESFVLFCVERVSQLDSLSSLVSRGGPGKLRMTSWASCDRDTITSFSFTAVCMRRTVPSSLWGF